MIVHTLAFILQIRTSRLCEVIHSHVANSGRGRIGTQVYLSDGVVSKVHRPCGKTAWAEPQFSHLFTICALHKVTERGGQWKKLRSPPESHETCVPFSLRKMRIKGELASLGWSEDEVRWYLWSSLHGAWQGAGGCLLYVAVCASDLKVLLRKGSHQAGHSHRLNLPSCNKAFAEEREHKNFPQHFHLGAASLCSHLMALL